MDGNETYCGDYFTAHTNIKSLCCTPETNMSIVPQLKKIMYLWGEKKKKSHQILFYDIGTYLKDLWESLLI